MPDEIEQAILAADGVIQEIKPHMTIEEAALLQERAVRANLGIIIAIAKQQPQLKAFYNGNGQWQQRTEQEEKESGSA